MKHSKFKKIISVIKPKTNKEDTQRNEDGYIEIASGTERIEASHRMLRIVSTAAAGAVLVTGIGVTGMLLRNNRIPKPAITEDDSNLSEITSSSDNTGKIKDAPFSKLLSDKYTLQFPNLNFTDTMREKVSELFSSVKSWKQTNNYNRFLHYNNGGTWVPFARRITFETEYYCLNICDDNIIEYSVYDGCDWDKIFYECDSLSLINGIAEIMESEFTDNGIDFDDDLSDFYINAGGREIYLSETQKAMVRLCMKGSSWKMETMEANRDLSLFDLSLVSKGSGRLDILAENYYSDSNTGLALFTDKNGITYTCNNNCNLGNDVIYIVSAYDYADIRADITICDDKVNRIIYSDDQNSALLENFIYNNFYSMLRPYSENNYSIDSSTKYSVSIEYKLGDTALRTEDFSIGSNGGTGRVDYVIDPVIGVAPAGCMNYSIDISAFESKLNELLKQKNDPKTPENKEEKKADEVQPTTESSKNENKPANDENKQDKPVNNEEPEKNNSNTFSTVVQETTEIEPYDSYTAFHSTKPGVYIFDDDNMLIASAKTHDITVLNSFVTETLDPMVKNHVDAPDDSLSDYECVYTVLRIYKDTDGVLRYTNYMVGNDGHILVFFYVYELWNDGVMEWVPDGFDGNFADYEKFSSSLKELLNNSELSNK